MIEQMRTHRSTSHLSTELLNFLPNQTVLKLSSNCAQTRPQLCTLDTQLFFAVAQNVRNAHEYLFNEFCA